ncbi:MAG TPA: pyruvate kinase [Fimbriimonadaceae bacterium]|nr:pyruvate kinase [Fimbriimonadaceae bacterium]
MRRRTKIVCTIGPSVDSRRSIARLIQAGMNVARLNCGHGDWETRAKWIGWIRELSPDVAPVGVLVDLQGPKFRIGVVRDNAFSIKPGQKLTLGSAPGCDVPVHQPEILCELKPGDRVLLGDGNVELRIRSDFGGEFVASAITGGIIRSKQGITVVGKIFASAAVTKKDLDDLRQALDLDVDFVALSYVNSADDLLRIRDEIDRRGKRTRICAKIETRAAIRNIESILAAADMAMVARGDLGLQMSLEDLPIAQKDIIRRCNHLGKPVVTATQMLESMMEAPRPTRAEVADIANAILDGTDAVMLSGETAAGKYPLECVRRMAGIARKAETLIDHDGILNRQTTREAGKIGSTHAIALAVARLAQATTPRAILTTSTSGQTPCLVSKYRPSTSILSASWNESTHRQMSVVWGVESICIPIPRNTDEIVQNAMEGFVLRKRLRKGDRVIVTSGVPAGTPGSTNLILNEIVR